MNRKLKAFTLAELLIVLAIMGILILLVVAPPMFGCGQDVIDDGKESPTVPSPTGLYSHPTTTSGACPP